jgi:hypothetical protein
MFRFEYSVTTRAPRALAWEVFSDWRRWNEFAKFYGELNWCEGRPWDAGSRLEIEIIQPVKTTVSHVITSCQPGRKVGWIDHSLGVVLAQWVSFEEKSGNGTRVHTWGDIVHSGVAIAGQTAEEIITGFTKTWYENYKTACDRRADGRVPSPEQRAVGQSD